MTTTSIIYRGFGRKQKTICLRKIPAGGFEAQYIQLLSDSVSYFIGKCHLPDEAIRMGDGMATVSHFNTVPLVAHLHGSHIHFKSGAFGDGAEHQDHQSGKEGAA